METKNTEHSDLGKAGRAHQPYVGITGVKTLSQVEEVSACFRKYGLCQEDPGGYQGMLGFLVSYKRLADKVVAGDQSPAARDLADLCARVPAGLLPMMHYHAVEKDSLLSQVQDLFSIGSMYEKGICRALQLNVDWPPLGQLDGIISAFPEMRIVLQLPRRAMEGRSAEQIAAMAKPYALFVAYALIDPSGGKGIPFDVERSTEVMLALQESLPGVVIGAAGGLRGENVKARVEEIRRRFPSPFCIDAQGGLRDPIGESSVLNIGKADDYIKGAVEGLAGFV